MFGILIALAFGINTAYQNHQQYLAANKPRLQIINVGFDEASLKNNPAVTYQLANLGGYPTEVTRADFGWMLADALDPKPWETLANKKVINMIPFAVSKERPFSQKILLYEAGSNLEYLMRHLLNPFYIFGDYYYHDQIADRDMVYKMVVQVKLDGSFIYVINENEPLP